MKSFLVEVIPYLEPGGVQAYLGKPETPWKPQTLGDEASRKRDCQGQFVVFCRRFQFYTEALVRVIGPESWSRQFLYWELVDLLWVWRRHDEVLRNIYEDWQPSPALDACPSYPAYQDITKDAMCDVPLPVFPKNLSDETWQKYIVKASNYHSTTMSFLTELQAKPAWLQYRTGEIYRRQREEHEDYTLAYRDLLHLHPAGREGQSQLWHQELWTLERRFQQVDRLLESVKHRQPSGA